MKKRFLRTFALISIMTILLSSCPGFGHHRDPGPKGGPRHERRHGPGPKHHGPGPKHGPHGGPGHHRGHR